MKRMRRTLRLACGALLAASAGLLAGAPLAAQQNPVNLFVVDIRQQGDQLTVGEPQKITASNGRNTQPSFTPDGRAILFAAQRGGEGAPVDVYRFDLENGTETRVTATPENENSPTLEPDGRLMVVRWKPETLFEEYGPWHYSANGEPLDGVLPGPDTVGYYARVDDDLLALMRPGTEFSIALHDSRTGETVDLDSPVAPLPPQRIPGERAVSYTLTDPLGANQLRRLNVDTRQATTLAPTLPARTIHTWTPEGVVLMGRGSTLYALDPARDTDWRPIATFDDPELREISAYTVSPQGDRLVLVSSVRPPLATELQDSIHSIGVMRATAYVRQLAQEGRLGEYEVAEQGFDRIAAEWLRQGRALEAVQLSALVVELFPRSFRARASLGDAHLAAGDPSLAADEYRAALELNPRSSEAERQEYERVEGLLGRVDR